jgi:MFS family permease
MMAKADGGGWDEFSGRKLLVLIAFLGVSTSMNAMMVYGLGSFIAPLQAEFGWKRGDISFAVSVLTFGVFLFAPVAGRLCDWFGAAVVGATSLLCYGLAVILMTFLINSLASLWAAFFIVAMLGVASTPIVMLRPITAAFDRRRGLALGIALTGGGLAGFWVPNLTTEIIASHGWRAAYWAIGALAICVAPIVWFGFGPSERRVAVKAPTDAPKTGFSFPEARRTGNFWFASALAFTMALGVGGMIVHLIPLFQDLGADAKAAARLASALGIASAVSRLLIGLCLDRFAATWVTITALLLGAAGLAIFYIGSLSLGLLAVVLIGLLLGAEVDLLAYLASRQFGQKAFGAIYGWFYALYSLGFGLSPFVIGNLHDRFGSYEIALVGSIACLALAALAVLGLRTPPHPQAVTA